MFKAHVLQPYWMTGTIYFVDLAAQMTLINGLRSIYDSSGSLRQTMRQLLNVTFALHLQ